MDFNIAKTIGDAIGTSEPAIKLLISLFIGYPLAFVYRSSLVYTLPPTAKHTFFIIIGYCICHYNFGLDSLHLVANVTVIYVLLQICGGSKFSVIFALVFNTGYLVLGYHYQMAATFGISWTMPLCVVTLKLTAVAFDLYDGLKKHKDEDSAELRESALTSRPGYLEMLGHVFYFGGVMVGPQFSLKRYVTFVRGEFCNEKTGEPPNSVSMAMRKLALGVTYIAVFQAILLYIPDEYIGSEEFYDLGFFSKCFIILLWGKNAVNKYIGVWLVTEGTIILTGMSYNGVSESGSPRWDACCNIHVWNLEAGESFAHFIRSFNVNTNQWMSRYIFKRLRFLGNKTFSQMATMFYLALWHGLQSGYYVCFFLELVQTNGETQWLSLWKRCEAAGFVPRSRLLHWAGRAVRKLILMFLWSYALLGFILHDYSRWMPIYSSVYHIGFVLPVMFIVFGPLMSMVVPRKPHSNGVSSETSGSKKEL